MTRITFWSVTRWIVRFIPATDRPTIEKEIVAILALQGVDPLSIRVDIKER